MTKLAVILVMLAWLIPAVWLVGRAMDQVNRDANCIVTYQTTRADIERCTTWP